MLLFVSISIPVPLAKRAMFRFSIVLPSEPLKQVQPVPYPSQPAAIDEDLPVASRYWCR